MQKRLTAYYETSSEARVTPAIKQQQEEISSSSSKNDLIMAIEANKKSLEDFCRDRIRF